MDVNHLGDRDGNSEATGWEEPPYVLAEVVPEPGGYAWDEPPRQRRLARPLVLFVITCLSTFWAGAYFSSKWDHDLTAALLDGLKYSSAVMTILLCHEMGHFIQAWRYGVFASLPYFLPMPASPIGTFGAVIFMDPRKGDRRAVFDIGISGPLAGLVPTILFCILGLSWSSPTFVKPSPNEIMVGSSYLFATMVQQFVPHAAHAQSIDLHPMAMAGWVGLLITSLNLFPIGQLDGGHVLYTMLRRKAHAVATVIFMGSIAAIVFFGRYYPQLYSWSLMLVLLSFLGTRHPPTADDQVPLGALRYVLGWLVLAFVPLAFTPIPMAL